MKQMLCLRITTFHLTVLLLIVPSTMIYSHATLVDAVPEPGSELEVSPERVTLEFSEPVEQRGSEIIVLNSRGERVGPEDSMVSPEDPTLITTPVPQPLDRGTYSIVWRTLSSVDGHVVRGSFVFAVGEPVDATAIDSGAKQVEISSRSAALFRWMILLGFALVAGGIVVYPVVLKLSGPPDATPGGGVDLFGTRCWTAAEVGAVLLAVGSIGQLSVQATQVNSPVIPVLFETFWGNAWIVRMAAWSVMVVGLLRVRFGKHCTRTDRRLPVAAICAGAVFLLSIAITTHVGAGTAVRIPAVANHYLHLATGGIWAGTVLVSFLVIPVLPKLQSSFRLLIIPCGVIVILTGIVNSWIQVGAHEAMGTPYGRVLSIKVLLLLPLLFLEVFKAHWTGPEKYPGGIAGGRAIVLILILVSVAFLAYTEPARLAAARDGMLGPERPALTEEIRETEVTMTLDPGTVGSNRIMFDLVDRYGEPVAGANIFAQLYVLPTHAIHLDERPVEVSPGRYVLEDVPFGIEGIWEVGLVIQRPDAFDAQTSFRFPVTEPVPVGDRGNQPDRDTAWIYLTSVFTITAIVITGTMIAARVLKTGKNEKADPKENGRDNDAYEERSRVRNVS